MFQLWFNTFFINDEETVSLDCGSEMCGGSVSPTGTKMNVTRTMSDQTRVVDRVVTEQRQLRKQLNTELLNIARRVNSNDHLNMPRSDHLKVCKFNGKPARHKLPAAQFYDVSQPRPRTFKVLRLRKDEIDRANKDKQHRLYPADFSVSRSNICLCLLKVAKSEVTVPIKRSG